MRIKDIMQTNLFVLHEDDKLKDVTDVMKLEKIRHIPIVNKNHILIGLVTYKDLLRALALKPGNIQIKEIMKKEVKAVEPDTPLKGAIDVMIVNKFGCLPVVDAHRKLIGLVTEFDLLKTLYEITAMPDDFYIKSGL